MTKTRLSRRISSRSPSEIAWRYVFSATALLVVRGVEVLGARVDALQEVARLGERRLLGPPERVVQELLDVASDLLFLVVVEVGVLAQPGSEALDRVTLRPLLEQRLRDVEGVVVDGVTLHAQGQALEQRRAAALAGALDRPLRLAVDGEDVGAVDDDALEAVGLRAVGDVLGRVLEVGRRRVRPLVVVADEDDRQPARPGERHRLVRVAPRRGALPEPADGDAALAADAERERAAGRDREHRGQVADHRDQAEPRVGHVDVPVPPFRGAVDAAHVLREDAPRLDTAGDVDAHVAVERRADVVGPHCGGDANGGGFVAAAGVERARDLALAIKDVAALLDAARDEHVAVDAEQVLAVEPRLAHLADGADGLRFSRNRHAGRNLTIPTAPPARDLPAGLRRLCRRSFQPSAEVAADPPQALAGRLV